MRLRLADIAGWTGGRLVGADGVVTGVASDTRQLASGDLFVALAGARVDGHDLLEAAAARGAVAALVARAVGGGLPQVVVDDVPAALGAIARAYRTQRDVRCVGITGSNGKTTVKTLAGAILARHGRAHVNAGNRNNEIGLPLSLLAMPDDTDYLVLEMGAGKPGDIAYLAAIAQPDVAVVNNVAPAHLERMGSLGGIAETKGALITALPEDGVAVVNADDAGAAYFTGLAGARRVLRFGFAAAADVTAILPAAPAEDPESSAFRLRTPQGEIDVRLPLSGRHNIGNALAACAIAEALGVPLETMRAGLQEAPPVAGRLLRRHRADGVLVIDDSYNANPGSFAAAISVLADEPGIRVLVMGDMGELGANARNLHVEVGELAWRRGITHLHAVGEYSRSAVAAFGSGATHYPDQASLVAALEKLLAPGMSVLVKGSRSAAMDRVVAALCGDSAADGGARHAA
jgi:UDP-N-acetylmuramoyl-tripeptide--D-alanyl-D-alanine ligase